MAPLGGASFYIGLYWERYLKCSLFKTTELILSKFGRKYLYGLGIKACTNQGAGPFWGSERARLQ